MNPTGAPPEEAIVDAVLSDPVSAEILLTSLAVAAHVKPRKSGPTQS
jgi:hypothetical protein